MQAIVLFSHGSLLCGAERNLLDLACSMREAGDAPIVEAGFLNYTEPSFSTAVRRCIDAGATRIVVAPYFLIAGKFIVEDLARCIAGERARHPDVDFLVAGVIGPHPLMGEAVLASASNARPEDSWDEAMALVAEWCRENPRCPLYGSRLCRVSAEAIG